MKGNERKRTEKRAHKHRENTLDWPKELVTLQTILCDESKESCLAGCKKAHKHEAFVCIFICKWMINQESFVRRSCAPSCFLRSFSVLDTDGRLLELGKDSRRSLFVCIIVWFLYFMFCVTLGVVLCNHSRADTYTCVHTCQEAEELLFTVLARAGMSADAVCALLERLLKWSTLRLVGALLSDGNRWILFCFCAQNMHMSTKRNYVLFS